MAPETVQQTVLDDSGLEPVALDLPHDSDHQPVTSEPSVASTALDHRCGRCNGLMVEERFIDLLDDTGNLQFMALRCVQCGEVVDPVILNNRGRNVRPPITRPRMNAPSFIFGQQEPVSDDDLA